jgi:hypothetical protein
VADLHRWVEAGDLSAGSLLQTGAGRYVQVNTTRRWTAQSQEVRNLTVDGTHTYYAVAGNTAVLVHNCEPSTWTPDANYSPEEVAKRSADSRAFYETPQDIHDLVDAVVANPNYPQRMTGPATNRVRDFFNGNQLSAARRAFWQRARIFDNGNPSSQARVIIKDSGEIGYAGRDSSGAHNYGQIFNYPWAKRPWPGP